MNSSELAYDLLGRIYGDMIEKGQLTRLADSIYPLGNSFDELPLNYAETLRRAELCNLTFKPKKTIICPKTSIIFGWQLSSGEWRPQEHMVSSLTRAEKPKTFKQLRSFLGAYKQINACVDKYAIFLSPFEKILGSRSSAERITWTEELEEAFTKLKQAAADPEGIFVPLRTDKLVTASDYSKAHSAIGGALTIVRKVDDKEVKLLGGHYSAILDKDQSRWLTCECEALAVKKVINHFEPEIRDSDQETLHLCDNMPTVLAWKKLLTGKFSTNARITTFLLAMAAHPVRLEHRPGSSLDLADHASRNPAQCKDGCCAVCTFLKEDLDIGNNLEGVRSIEEGIPSLAPFLQIGTWLDIQKNDSTHTRLVNLIKSGQSPERKRTGGEETILKHLHTMYMKGDVKITSSGLVVVRARQGFMDGFVISVPTRIFPGLVFAFHHKASHPKKSQMFKLLSRYYFCTGMQNVIEKVTESCLQCMSTQKLPKPLLAQSTTIPSGVGTKFSSDVLERQTQKILITKDELTHFAAAVILEDQTSESLRQGLIQTISPIISGARAVVRVDPAPGFQTIALNQSDDVVLTGLKLKVELGDSLNMNKNPIAEAGIGELKTELLALAQQDAMIDQATLSLAVRNLNMRIRAGGLSACERLMSRDMLTGKNLAINDETLKDDLDERRKKQHQAAKSNSARPEPHKISIGDLVMMKDLKNLDKPRDLYIVARVDGCDIWIRRSEKKWRKRLYRVKPEQLIVVMAADNVVKEDKVAIDDQPNDAVNNEEVVQDAPRQQEQPAPPRPRHPSRTCAAKTKLAIQQGYRYKLTKIKKRKIQKKKVEKEKFVFVTFGEEQQPNRDDSVNLINFDLINFDSDHDTSGLGILESTPRSDADRDYFHDVTDSMLQTPVLSPIQSPILQPAEAPSLTLMDSATQMDRTPTLSPSLSVTSMTSSARISLLRRFNSQSSSSTQSLAWDAHETLTTLQLSLTEEDVFLDTVEDIQPVVPSSDLEDEVFSDAQEVDTQDFDASLQTIDPEPAELPASPQRDTDNREHADQDRISARTRSSRSDQSPENIQRLSRLRRPLVRAWADYDIQDMDDLASSAAKRRSK